MMGGRKVWLFACCSTTHDNFFYFFLLEFLGDVLISCGTAIIMVNSVPLLQRPYKFVTKVPYQIALLNIVARAPLRHYLHDCHKTGIKM